MISGITNLITGIVNSFTQENNTPEKDDVIEKISKTALENLYFPSEEEKTSADSLIRKVVSLSLSYRLIENPLSPEKRRFKNECEQAKDAFVEYCETQAIALNRDEEGDITLWNRINDLAQESLEPLLASQKKELIIRCRSRFTYACLSPEEINTLYQTCLQEVQLAEAVQKKLKNVISLAKLPTDENNYALTISPEQSSTVCIEISGNQKLADSIYFLLDNFDMRSGYRGHTAFKLSTDQLQILGDRLSEIATNYDQFTEKVRVLLGNPEDVDQYVSLHRSDLCHFNLDLTNHPEKNFFVEHLSRTFSELNTRNGRSIAVRYLDHPFNFIMIFCRIESCFAALQQFVDMQALVKEYTGISDFSSALQTLREAYGITDLLDIVKQYKAAQLHAIYMAILGNNARPDPTLSVEIANAFNNANTFEGIESATERKREEIMKNAAYVMIKGQPPEFVPTNAQIEQLYGTERMVNYPGGIQHANIRRLMTTLKNAEMFKEGLRVNPDVSSAVNELEHQVLARLNNYHRLDSYGHYGQNMVNEAIKHLEVYVATVVYATQSKVSLASIEKSLRILAATVDAPGSSQSWFSARDMERGCTTGLAGRIQSIRLALTSSVGNDFKDDMTQHVSDCVDAAFQNFQGSNSENSMTVFRKRDALEILRGIEEPKIEEKNGFFNRLFYRIFSKPLINSRFNEIEIHDHQTRQFVQKVAELYSPHAVFDRARSFYVDKYKEYSRENQDEAIYELFHSLKFPGKDEELDQKYRIDGSRENRWQISRFQSELPLYLIPLMVQQGILFKNDRPSEKKLRIEGKGIVTF